MKTIRQQAEELAYALGMPVYIRGDRIVQDAPGIRIEPRSGATPLHLGAPSMEMKESETD